MRLISVHLALVRLFSRLLDAHSCIICTGFRQASSRSFSFPACEKGFTQQPKQQMLFSLLKCVVFPVSRFTTMPPRLPNNRMVPKVRMTSIAYLGDRMIFSARSRRSHGFCRMPCLELGPDNWLTCPHLGKMLRMKTKVQVQRVLFHTACTHKEQGLRTVQDSEQVIVPNSKTLIPPTFRHEDHTCGFISHTPSFVEVTSALLTWHLIIVSSPLSSMVSSLADVNS